MVKRHPLVAFFALTFLLSWWPWPLHAFGLMPMPIASFGPFLAALVVLALTEGKAGILGLLRRMVRWRVGLGWWVVALLLPVAMSGGAALLNIAVGAEAPTAADSAAGPPSRAASPSCCWFPASAEPGRNPAGGAMRCPDCRRGGPPWPQLWCSAG